MLEVIGPGGVTTSVISGQQGCCTTLRALGCPAVDQSCYSVLTAEKNELNLNIP